MNSVNKVPLNENKKVKNRIEENVVLIFRIENFVNRLKIPNQKPNFENAVEL